MVKIVIFVRKIIILMKMEYAYIIIIVQKNPIINVLNVNQVIILQKKIIPVQVILIVNMEIKIQEYAQFVKIIITLIIKMENVNQIKKKTTLNIVKVPMGNAMNALVQSTI